MKKLFKLLGFLASAVFVLLIALVVALTLFIDPNDYKDEITVLVKEQTGRTLSIEGDLELSFFPWIGVEIGKVQLANAPGFGDTPFARVEKAGVKIELLPVLRNQLVADTIILDGVQLNLVVKPNGQNNWKDLADAAEKKPAEKSKAAKDTTETAEKGLVIAALDINGIKISNAQFILDDQKSKSYIAIENLKLQTGHLTIGKPVEFEASLDFKDKKTAKPRHIELSAELAVDMEKQTLKVSDLVFETGELQLQGNVNGTSILDDNRKFTGKIKVSEFVPRDLMREFGIAVPETKDPTVLGKANLEASFVATSDRVKVSGLKMKLDDTSLQGQVSVSHFKDPIVKFTLDIDEIDLDRYLPPPQTDAGSSSQEQTGTKQAATSKTMEGKATTGNEILLPVETLEGLNLEGSLKVGKMKLANLRSEQIEVGLVANKGNIRVHPAKAKLYQGSYNGDIRLDVRGKTPTLSMNEKLSGVQAEPLFIDVADLDWIMGRADMAAKLTSKGNTMNALKKGLNGKAQFSFMNGAIKGYNVGHMIRKVNATFAGQPAPREEIQETDFSEFKGTATIKNGVVHNVDLLLNSPLLKITGAGQADLVREQLNYRVKAEIVANIQLQGGDPLAKLKGEQIPLLVTGSFDDPKFKLELDKILEAKVKAKIKEKVEEKKQELKQKLQDKLKNKLGDRLKGLFGR